MSSLKYECGIPPPPLCIWYLKLWRVLRARKKGRFSLSFDRKWVFRANRNMSAVKMVKAFPAGTFTTHRSTRLWSNRRAPLWLAPAVMYEWFLTREWLVCKSSSLYHKRCIVNRCIINAVAKSMCSETRSSWRLVTRILNQCHSSTYCIVVHWRSCVGFEWE